MLLLNVGNLPDDVTEEEIRELLGAQAAAQIDKITLTPGVGVVGPSAMVQVTMTRRQTETVARRIHGRIHKGRRITAWVPLMSWSEVKESRSS